MIAACLPRSRGVLLAAVDQIDPEHNPELLKHDVTGDGLAETFCNVFVRQLLLLLGLNIPVKLANDLFAWFAGPEAALEGWRKVDHHEAAARAELGFPTIGVWRNTAGHGHVVVVVPAIGGTGMHSAQAGARNWNNAPIERAGLLAVAYSFFTHE